MACRRGRCCGSGTARGLSAADPNAVQMRAELSDLKVTALKRRAQAYGVSEELLDDVDDADDVRGAVIELILEATSDMAIRAAEARRALESELAAMKLKALKQRARSCGVSEELLEDADDADDIRGTVIELILDAASSTVSRDSEERRALESELAAMKLKALKQRARSCGVSEELLEDADDADDIRGTVIELILDAASSTVSRDSEERRALESELAAMKLKALKQRARSCGVSEELLEDADDADDIRGTVIELILDAASSTVSRDSEERRALESELAAMKLKALKQRARSCGVSEELLEDADDADDIRGTVIELILDAASSTVSRDSEERRALESELAAMKLKALKQRARSCGVSEELLEDADDADDIRGTVIELILDAASSTVSRDSEERRALESELAAMKLKALKQRARSCGVSEELLEDADDADDIRGTVIELILDAASSTVSRDSEERRALESELAAMKLKALKQRARSCGVSEELLEDADDADDIRGTVIELILDAASSTVSRDSEERRALESELAAMKLKALKQRARSCGVSEELLEDADDADDIRGTVIELIAAANPMSRGNSEAVHPDRSHFGNGPAAGSASGLAPGLKHVMLSYQWDHQVQVKRVYDLLATLGMQCWMDISGGMGADIYDSMAEGVSNASVVVCFMSQKYQESENCMLEAKYAKQCGVSIVPVMIEGEGWKPSGWLALITAGALWVSLRDESQIEDSVRQLHGQIQKMIGTTMQVEDVGDEGVATASEAKEELERLRGDLVHSTAKSSIAVLADPSEPATIPAGVPKLPPKFQSTEQIRELTRLVLSTTVRDMSMSRVGFWGMGGIGKTVTGAAIVRDEAVRLHYEVIIWLPLGASPVIAKLQNLCHMQCTGTELSHELSGEEKKEALQQVLKGKRVLLCLDDLWEEQHESELNLVDESAGSKVLISTRMRSLLEGGHQVEVGLPSAPDSARMLLAAADADTSDGRQPRGVDEVVELCGRLPLALGIAGRLAASLGLVGTADWSDMIGVLKEELHESHSGGSQEGMIRASLRGLKGSAQEQTNVRSLLLMFALIPEDTFCPLEAMLLMFNAVHEGSNASMMHIRKWLRILQNRSLVLGTVDRPSVHDLVLDFAVSQHADGQLCTLHRRVVDAFRQARPGGVFGRHIFEKSAGDPMCAYVCNEIIHHISEACQVSAGLDAARTSWLADTPQDVIVAAVGRAVGKQRLSSWAEAAESGADWWLAARYHSVLQTVTYENEGLAPAFESSSRALDMIEKMLLVGDSADVDDVDEVLLRQLNFYLMSMRPDLKPRDGLIQRLQASETRKRFPAEAMAVSAYKIVPLQLEGAFTKTGEHTYSMMIMLAEAGRSHPNPPTRYLALQAAYNFPAYWSLYMLSDEFSWDFYCGERGCTVIQAAQEYDFERAHSSLVASCYADFVAWGSAHSIPLAMHWGDMCNAYSIMDKALAVLRGPVLRQDSMAAETTAVGCTGGFISSFAHSCNFPTEQRIKIAACMSDFSLTWQEADATIDTAVALNPAYRKRGETVKGVHLWSAEQCAWLVKCGWYLCGAETGVSADEVASSLPSIEDIIDFNPGQDLFANWDFSNLFVNVACVWEKLGRHDEALRYVTAALENDSKHGGSVVPSARVSAHMVQGRCQAALGHVQGAAEAFEAAVELADKYGLWLFQALAVKDLKLRVLDRLGHEEHGSRRLGAALRLLVGPAEMLTPLMDGLDAAELMALPSPNQEHIEYKSGQGVELGLKLEGLENA